jgi:hypothetical protein
MEQMSDEKHGELVDYYGVYAKARFRTRNGRPLSVRSHEKKIHKFNLPVIVTGHSALIDPVQGDARLREFAQKRRPQKVLPRGIAKEAAAALAAADDAE